MEVINNYMTSLKMFQVTFQLDSKKAAADAICYTATIAVYVSEYVLNVVCFLSFHSNENDRKWSHDSQFDEGQRKRCFQIL